MNILLVDDDQNLAKTLAYGLEGQLNSAHITYCFSGAEAQRLCEQTGFDVVISDFKMPGMSGLELFAKLRARRDHPFLILITAYGSKDLEQEAMCYADAYISKPFEIPILIKFILQLDDAVSAPCRQTSVLVLEDDFSLRRLISKVLRSSNLDVHEASTVREAQAMLETRAFDVVISDIQVPDGRGTDFIRKNRALLSQNGSIVILATGEAQYRYLEEELGISMFLEKPISVHDLVTLVQRWSTNAQEKQR